MNYIHQLQQQVERRDAAIVEAREQIDAFMAHLASSKFTGTDTDGSRKDWISTGDVMARLQDLRSALRDTDEVG